MGFPKVMKKKHKNPKWVEKIIDAYWFIWKKQDIVKSFLRGLIINRQHVIDTHLPIRAWHEADVRMLYGMMSLLTEFMDHEIFISDTDGVTDADAKYKYAVEEMRAIYKWWKDYPKRQDEIDVALKKWDDRVLKITKEDDSLNGLVDYLNQPTRDVEEERLACVLYKMQAILSKEEQDMLIRLVKIRKFMW
jgi:hypothetical protein